MSAAIILRRATASQEVMLGTFLDDTDGKTPETALTIANTDIKIFKSGATSEVNKNSGGATHVSSGRYYAVFDATDSDTVGPNGEINVAMSGALPVRRPLVVLHENVYDVLFGTTAPSTHTADAVAALVLATPANKLATDGTGRVTVGTNADKTGYSISGTTTTLDALQTALSSAHGAGSWATATGFSTHSAADVVTALGTGSTLTALATGANLAIVASYLDTEVAAIKAKTDNLPDDPADQSLVIAATNAIVALIGTPSTTLAGDIATRQATFTAATSVSFPTNFAALAITAGGAVTAGTVSDKTGYGLADGAITDAKITFPAESAGRPTTFLAAMRRVWEWVANRRVRTRSTGALVLYGADDTTPLEAQTQSTTGGTGSEVDTQTKGA